MEPITNRVTAADVAEFEAEIDASRERLCETLPSDSDDADAVDREHEAYVDALLGKPRVSEGVSARVRRKIEYLMGDDTVDSFNCSFTRFPEIKKMYSLLSNDDIDDDDLEFFTKLFVSCMELDRFMTLTDGNHFNISLRHVLGCYHVGTFEFRGIVIRRIYVFVAEVLNRVDATRDECLDIVISAAQKGKFYHPEAVVFAALMLRCDDKTLTELGKIIQRVGHAPMTTYIDEVRSAVDFYST
jgi:hypothetical protein